MVSKIFSGALEGFSARLIEVEVACDNGLRSFHVVGLVGKAIEEAKERVAAAIKNTKLLAPYRQRLRVLVNLAPADLRKEGSLYDLPIALGYLLSSKQTKFNPKNKMFLGELALDGSLKPIKGALCFALLAKKSKFQEIILPLENAKEASLVNFKGEKIKIKGVKSLSQALAYLEGVETIKDFSVEVSSLKEKKQNFELDFGWIKGQEHSKRGLEIAAAGGHNILLEGPPGAGKSLMAKAVISILPRLNFEESLELTRIYSAAGFLKNNAFFLTDPPFRAPHHTSSEAALIGGGSPPRPGEITLAHRGILFLDEFPEFHRDVLESLRQPLEDREITVQRAKFSLNFPANFTLIAAANPCPCGNYKNPDKICTCTPSQIAAYRRKLTGPLMDRIDIFSWVPSLKYEELISASEEGISAAIRLRVQKARQIQKERYRKEAISINAEMLAPHIKQYCRVPPETKNILKKYVNSGQLSARGYHRTLKVARTIADLAGKNNINADDINEALSYRLREDN